MNLEEIFKDLESDEVIREELAKKAREVFPDLEDRFKPGTFGHHELTHLSWVQYEIWQHYIASHPSVSQIEKAGYLSSLIESLMFEFHQVVACSDSSHPQEQK